MVMRAIKYGLMAITAAALMAVAGAAWLIGTADGLRFAMEQISRRTPLAISARQVEGGLFERVQLRDVRMAMAPFTVQIEELRYRWQPVLLLSGNFAVRELSLAGVRIQNDDAAQSPPDLSWPRIPAVAWLVGGRIERLQVSGLTYRLRHEEPIELMTISAVVSWRGASLFLSELAVTSTEGRIDGGIEAGFDRPTLRMDLKATPAKPLAGIETLSVQGRFQPGSKEETLAGRFAMAGSSGKKSLLELAGEAAMTRSGFQFRELRLVRPGQRGSLTGVAGVTLTEREPLLMLNLRADGIDLSSALKRTTDLGGTLTLSGTPTRYRGAFTLANRGRGWQAVQLAGAYEGGSDGIELSRLTGSLLDGSVQGRLRLGWGREVSLRGTVKGRNLNPAVISPDWTGRINLDFTAAVAWPDRAPPNGEVSGRLLQSRLHGRELTGEIQADFAADDLHVRRMALNGKGFDLGAAGLLGERLAFTASVRELGRLIPRAKGEIQTAGWVRWRDGRLTGSVDGQGKGIVAAGMRAATVNLTARTVEGSGNPLSAAVQLRKAAYGRFRADSIRIDAEGTPLGHTVHAALQAPGAEAQIGLTGSYDRGSWRGRITRFSGQDRIGPWSLDRPASLSVTKERLLLAPLLLRGTESERVEATADLAVEPPAASLRIVWNGLNLARVSPWLPEELQLAGRLSGQVAANILPGERLDLTGQASLLQGRFRWRRDKSEIAADSPAADLSWRWQGALPASAEEVAAGALSLSGRASLAGRWVMAGRGITVERGSLNLDGDSRGLRARAEVGLPGGAKAVATFASSGQARLALPETGEATAEWSGIDMALYRAWLPAEVGLAGIVQGRMVGKLLPGSELDVAGNVSVGRGKIHWKKEAQGIAADLRTAELSWGWRGRVPATAAQLGAGRLVVNGRVAAAGDLTVDGRTIGIERAALSVDGNPRGLDARIELALAGGGAVKGGFSSAKAAALALPTEGKVDLEWADIDLERMRPWLPGAIRLTGSLNGRLTGNLLSAERFTIHGETALSRGTVRWARPEGELLLNLRSATLAWDWQQQALRGSIALALAERGAARGSFQLPIPARLPVAVDKKGPLFASLTAQVLEKGVLASLFPGLIQESRGEVDADLSLAGNWEDPLITGRLKLAKAGAYLPTAGIRLGDLQAMMRLEKGVLHVDSFRADSGPGHIEGRARVRFRGWRLDGYSGTIGGERFRVVYLPELQLLATPRLTFEGNAETLAVRGEVVLPELLIFGPPSRSVVLPSPDVILEGVAKPVQKESPLALDVQVRLTLGDRVLVKLEGIDARFEGGVNLEFQSLDAITSRGEIRVAKGRYSAYGVNLEIVRGRLFYAGAPLGRPTLDILALRSIGDVRAGVTAGGILRAPQIKLYSEPAMPDVDILSYIVFGRRVGNSSNSEQASMMAQAAGVLLSRGQSLVLQEQIKNRLGLSTLELQSGGAGAAGRMGYREIPSTPAGTASAATEDGVSQAMLTVGKYLTPELYLSYGRSLFTGGNLFRLRYDLSRHWQVETQTGSESGVDLYFKIEFD